MKRTSILALIVGAALGAAAQAYPYRVTVAMTAEDDGETLYLYDYDAGAPIDSTIVADNSATFSGTIDEPIAARIVSAKGRTAPFVLESGSIGVNPAKGYAFGSMLNDRNRQINDSLDSIAMALDRATTEQEQERLFNDLVAAIKTAISDNIDNPIALIWFVQLQNMLEPQEVIDLVDTFSDLKHYRRVNDAVAMVKRHQGTMPGNQFVDFTIDFEGKTTSLSDYVGKGKFVLVDFWASWCGPCRRQIPVLKEILQKWGPAGLEVLGVAVWDEPEATRSAIATHEITWDCIIGAQSIPTDIYGITGIPCIILFGPDGMIISRDKQSDELKAEVDAAMLSAGFTPAE